nr:MAG TPA: hypothetical protein [Caudoviricetes sp.]
MFFVYSPLSRPARSARIEINRMNCVQKHLQGLADVFCLLARVNKKHPQDLADVFARNSFD